MCVERVVKNGTGVNRPTHHLAIEHFEYSVSVAGGILDCGAAQGGVRAWRHVEARPSRLASASPPFEKRKTR